MDELFNGLWQVPRFTRRQGGFRPQIDCYRTEQPAAFHVIVELAGVDPAKIQVFTDEGTLIISGERRRPRCADRVYQQMEIDYGRFIRQIVLGAGRRRRVVEGDVPARHPDDRAAAGQEAGECRAHRDSRQHQEPAMSELFEEQLDVEDVELPSELRVLPLKDTVVFPDSVLPLAIGQERSVRLVDDVVSGDRLLALVASKDADIETPGWDDLYEVGAAAVVQKMLRVPDGSLRVLVQGIRRIRLIDKLQDEPYLVGRFIEVPDVYEETPETQALAQNVQMFFARLIGLVPYLPEELALAAANVEDPSALCHLVASTLRLKTAEKQSCSSWTTSRSGCARCS